MLPTEWNESPYSMPASLTRPKVASNSAFGSANAYVHFHSRIPLLSISGGESNSDAVEETALTGSAAH